MHIAEYWISRRRNALKFIWYIVALVVCFAALIVFLMTGSDSPEKNVAISVNKKHISLAEFNSRLASVHDPDRKNFINSLIVRELMIQAAQNEGIDKDESFRRSIQDYYEQSLVKQVMDKKIKSMTVAVTDDEIDRYVSFQNSTVKVTVFSADNENAANRGQYKSSEKKNIIVKNLCAEIGGLLESLKTGELTTPLCSDSGCEVYRLDGVLLTPASEKLSAENRNDIRLLLLERKKQKAMDAWIADLRAKSDITISIK